MTTAETGPASGVAHRLRKFGELGSVFGIDAESVREVVRSTGRTQSPAEPEWVPVMTATGDEKYQSARASASAGNLLGAHRDYMAASFWYFLARFPHILSPAAAQAYDKHVVAYLAAAQYLERPLEVVQIPLAGGSYPAYFRSPDRTVCGWPAVVVWGGMDVWKSDLELHLFTETLLDLGIATLAVDMPGTGQNPTPVSPEAEHTLAAAIEFLRGHRAIDPTRIGAWGLSAGGYFAVKLALQHPDLRGVVNVGGPVHHAWTPERYAALPKGAQINLARILGLGMAAGPEVVTERLSRLSLVRQNLLPATQYAPLLSINGELDDLVPISDLHILGEYGVRQDRMIYGDDGHVANRNWRHHHSLAAAWLAAKLAPAAG